MKHPALCASLLAAAAASFTAGCTSDGPADASLTVVNNSNFVIEEIYLTDVDARGWGANLLSGDALYPGEDLVLAVDCGLYDALLVDEDGVECELESIDLCFNDATWHIYNNTCVAFEAALQARKQAAEAAKAPSTGSAAQ
ncbi:MAG TPA: hypothetical protein VNO30_34105 [Kofleriaceae bacterium]|nr:hypothetical protein [Kofleriaceae bacterium]